MIRRAGTPRLHREENFGDCYQARRQDFTVEDEMSKALKGVDVRRDVPSLENLDFFLQMLHSGAFSYAMEQNLSL